MQEHEIDWVSTREDTWDAWCYTCGIEEPGLADRAELRAWINEHESTEVKS